MVMYDFAKKNQKKKIMNIVNNVHVRGTWPLADRYQVIFYVPELAESINSI